MSVNSSSSINDSHPFSLLSSNCCAFICFNSTTGFHIFTSFAITNLLLLLPLSSFVLHVGVQRWRQQRSTTATSHADLFTYHMVAMEIVSLMGCVFYCAGYYIGNQLLTIVGLYAFSIILPGQTLFHCLTCAERYLAVVHPITYLGLRKTGGVRIRNISIGCVWLMCVGWMGITHWYIPDVAVVPFLLLFAFSLSVSSFCSISVLRALARSSPGDGGRDRERVDQSKQRAFHTIVAIMGVLLLRFAGLLVCMITYRFIQKTGGDACVLLNSTLWCCLPSSLVLPLLFLHRAGKLTCCRNNTESG